MISHLKIHKGFVTVQRAKQNFTKIRIKCAAFWRLALNRYKDLKSDRLRRNRGYDRTGEYDMEIRKAQEADLPALLIFTI